jgi:putative resolvase
MSYMIKPKEMAKRLGVSVPTLQRWDNNGTLKAHRSPTNRRYYTEDQYLNYIGQSSAAERINVAYARVSTSSQKDDLKDQLDFIHQYANAKGIIVDKDVTDISSGLNYKRKKWNQLLDSVMQGKVNQIFITYKDRFIRFGFDWFERLCQRNGTKIVIINNPSTSPNQELVEDLISIIHVFSCRLYGLRKYKRKIKQDPSLNGGEKSAKNRKGSPISQPNHGEGAK